MSVTRPQVGHGGERRAARALAVEQDELWRARGGD